MEAYTHAIIKNNYFAWLYDYKSKNPGITLQTEYDLADEQDLPFDEDNEEYKEEVEDEEPTYYCGDLDEVEIALPRDGNGFDIGSSIPQRMNTRRHNKM